MKSPRVLELDSLIAEARDLNDAPSTVVDPVEEWLSKPVVAEEEQREHKEDVEEQATALEESEGALPMDAAVVVNKEDGNSDSGVSDSGEEHANDSDNALRGRAASQGAREMLRRLKSDEIISAEGFVRRGSMVLVEVESSVDDENSGESESAFQTSTSDDE